MRYPEPEEIGLCPFCLSITGHKAGCPKGPEPETIADCEICGDGIYSGEEHIDFESRKFHIECFCDKYTKKEIKVHG